MHEREEAFHVTLTQYINGSKRALESSATAKKSLKEMADKNKLSNFVSNTSAAFLTNNDLPPGTSSSKSDNSPKEAKNLKSEERATYAQAIKSSTLLNARKTLYTLLYHYPNLAGIASLNPKYFSTSLGLKILSLSKFDLSFFHNKRNLFYLVDSLRFTRNAIPILTRLVGNLSIVRMMYDMHAFRVLGCLECEESALLFESLFAFLCVKPKIKIVFDQYGHIERGEESAIKKNSFESECDRSNSDRLFRSDSNELFLNDGYINRFNNAKIAGNELLLNDTTQSVHRPSTTSSDAENVFSDINVNTMEFDSLKECFKNDFTENKLKCKPKNIFKDDSNVDSQSILKDDSKDDLQIILNCDSQSILKDDLQSILNGDLQSISKDDLQSIFKDNSQSIFMEDSKNNLKYENEGLSFHESNFSGNPSSLNLSQRKSINIFKDIECERGYTVPYEIIRNKFAGQILFKEKPIVVQKKRCFPFKDPSNIHLRIIREFDNFESFQEKFGMLNTSILKMSIGMIDVDFKPDYFADRELTCRELKFLTLLSLYRYVNGVKDDIIAHSSIKIPVSIDSIELLYVYKLKGILNLKNADEIYDILTYECEGCEKAHVHYGVEMPCIHTMCIKILKDIPPVYRPSVLILFRSVYVKIVDRECREYLKSYFKTFLSKLGNRYNFGKFLFGKSSFRER